MSSVAKSVVLCPSSGFTNCFERAKKWPWLESLCDIRILLSSIKWTLWKCSRFLALLFSLKINWMVNGDFFLLLRDESKATMQTVINTWPKTCQVLAKTLLQTCHDLRLYLIRDKSISDLIGALVQYWSRICNFTESVLIMTWRSSACGTWYETITTRLVTILSH